MKNIPLLPLVTVIVVITVFAIPIETVLAQTAQSIPRSIKLSVSPTIVSDGDVVKFSGTFFIDEKPLRGAIVYLRDASNEDKVIGGDKEEEQAIIRVSPDGSYSFDWITSSGDVGPHKIYAWSMIGGSLSPYESYPIEVTVNALPYTLTIDASSLEVTEGETIEFSGHFLYGDSAIPNEQIIIVNSNQDLISDDGSFMVNADLNVIDESTTDAKGEYSVNWVTSSENIGSHKIYAMYKKDANIDLELEPRVSPTIDVSVNPLPELVLNPLPKEIVEGDFVPITGYITSNNFYDHRVGIKIGSDSYRLTDRINSDNVFAATWHVTSDDVGTKKVYAECFCDGENLQTLQQTITVSEIIHPSPLSAEIIPSTTSGEPTLKVRFQTDVSGGTPPYQYHWNFGDGKFGVGPDRIHYFRNTSEKPFNVILTVTDSVGQKTTDRVSIDVKQGSRSEPEIQVSGVLEEGSNLTFTAVGSYYESVDSYRWDFGDGNSGHSRTVNHSYDDDKEYPVKLTIRDSRGEVTVEKKLNIKNKAPVITSLYSEKYEIETNESLRFEGKFTDPGIDDTFEVIWYIDGKVYTDQLSSPQTVFQKYTFENKGDYEITFQVIDDDGAHDKKTTKIKVKDPFPWLVLVLVGIAVAGGGGVAIKTLMHPTNPPGPQNGPPDPPTESNPETKPPSNITVEYRSGLEK